MKDHKYQLKDNFNLLPLLNGLEEGLKTNLFDNCRGPLPLPLHFAGNQMDSYVFLTGDVVGDVSS